MSTPTTDTMPPPESTEDGAKPKGRRGVRRPGAAKIGTPRAGSGAKSSRSTRSASGARVGSAAVDKRRADGVSSLVQLMAFPLMAAPPTQLDAAVLLENADELGQAAAETARYVPSVADWLDKAVQTGPWAALATVVVKIGGQIAANHGWIPEKLRRPLGLRSPEEMRAHLAGQMEALQQQMDDLQRQAQAAAAAGPEQAGPESYPLAS